jgi:hypothetical protein
MPPHTHRVNESGPKQTQFGSSCRECKKVNMENRAGMGALTSLLGDREGAKGRKPENGRELERERRCIQQQKPQSFRIFALSRFRVPLAALDRLKLDNDPGVSKDGREERGGFVVQLRRISVLISPFFFFHLSPFPFLTQRRPTSFLTRCLWDRAVACPTRPPDPPCVLPSAILRSRYILTRYPAADCSRWRLCRGYNDSTAGGTFRPPGSSEILTLRRRRADMPVCPRESRPRVCH